GDMKNLLAEMPPDVRERVEKNPKPALEFYFLAAYLGSLADAEHLDRESPYKEEIETARLRVLTNAESAAYAAKIAVTREELERAYNEGKGRYPTEAEVRIITLYYSKNPGAAGSGTKNARTEPEAKALAASIHKQLAAGADFDQLQKQYSQDRTSDRGTIHRDDPIDGVLKKAIFAAKAGEIPDPIETPSAFYIVKLEALVPPSIVEIGEKLVEQVKQRKFNEWIQSLRTRFTPAMTAGGGATVDGKTLTADSAKSILAAMPPEVQMKAKGDMKNFLEEYFLVHYLASEADQAGLEKESPYKEEMKNLRLQVLYNAELTKQGNEIPVSDDEQEKWYRTHPELFTQADIHWLMVFYSSAASPPMVAGHKLKTQAEAQRLAGEIRAQIHEDADFETLHKKYPDDTQAEAVKMRRNDRQYAEALKSQIFAMKADEVSEPMPQPNAFYIVKLDKLTVTPYGDVRDDVLHQVKQQHFNVWFQALQKRFTVTIDDASFFAKR
ncbi:MAG: peptidyl-prolyl cis-trans isomerase, partial [Bryobacteraceae bacterium]